MWKDIVTQRIEDIDTEIAQLKKQKEFLLKMVYYNAE